MLFFVYRLPCLCYVVYCVFSVYCIYVVFSVSDTRYLPSQQGLFLANIMIFTCTWVGDGIRICSVQIMFFLVVAPLECLTRLKSRLPFQGVEPPCLTRLRNPTTSPMNWAKQGMRFDIWELTLVSHARRRRVGGS